jgi:MFS family permease
MRFGRALVVAVAMLGLSASSAFAQDYVTVERRGSTAGTVLRNTIAGGLLGSAVSGGIILYEMEINDNDDYNWERTLAWGAAIGLGAGLIWGIVDATSGPAYANMAPVARSPVRDGQSMTLDVRRRDQSAREMFPVFSGRF